MDALEIMADLENVFPFFQPIFSADEHRVIGYEVLGRYRGEEGIISLGPFLLDENIPEEYRLEVDEIILRKALEKALTLRNRELLFINRDAEILMHQNEEEFLALLFEYEEKGISIDRIVLELTERNFKGDFDHFDHLINYYRTYGIKIAIDNLGNESGHFDRIGQISPDILKIDLKVLRSTTVSHNFNDTLYSLSMLARKIGATMLFENIEMEFQLQFAWRNGGRYYQGFYLHKPQEEFVDCDILKVKLREKCHHFISHEKKKLQSLYNLTESFNNDIHEFLQKNRKYEDDQGLLLRMAQAFEKSAFRLYICDDDGFQKSPNIMKVDGSWIIQIEYKHKNWSWRPYFLENIMKMRVNKRGILSDLYTDIETGEMIRTFSFPINSTDYLFVDISYNFLYDHEGL